MPQVFNPGHRPSSPLDPNALVYCTADEVAEFLQLPLPDPISLSADTTITTGKINIPISGAEYRRWKIDATTNITVYDDDDPIGKTYTVLDAVSGGSGNVFIRATQADDGTNFETSKNAQLQINHALTNSKERGLTRSHVENLILKKQDYIDQVCRMAWRPRIVADEYQNFTTFKPYRRRYYTDYVGAVYLRHRAIQRILRLGVWQSDYYRELAGARTCMKVKDPDKLGAAGAEKIFICNGTPHTSTLTNGSGGGEWQSDFGAKTIAQNISNLINKDTATSRSAIAIGTLEEFGKQLYVNDEFLATANSDEGDGKIVITSLRSTEEGESNTIATTNPDVFIFSLGTGVEGKITGVAGSTFTLADAAPYTITQGLIYFTVGSTTHVARCSRSGNTFTVVEELVAGTTAALAEGITVRQQRLNIDMNDEERQYDWWSMEDNGAIMFNNQYPFYENHSLKVSYIYGERYLDKVIKEACIKMVAIDILLTDDYTVLFPEGSQNVDLSAKMQKMEEEVKRMLIPYQETIIVAGMGG